MGRHTDKSMGVKTRKPKKSSTVAASIPLSAMHHHTAGLQSSITKKRTFKDRQRDRKEKRAGMVGLVICGKLRGCEGVADVAFIEWLLANSKLQESPALLWEGYLREWDQVPEEQKPRSAHKPKNLHSQLRAILKEKSRFKEEVEKARTKLEAEQGLLPAETLKNFVVRTEGVAEADEAGSSAAADDPAGRDGNDTGQHESAGAAPAAKKKKQEPPEAAASQSHVTSKKKNKEQKSHNINPFASLMGL